MPASSSIARLLHAPDLGLFVLRMTLGGAAFFHGGQKLLAIFGGSGIGPFANWLDRLGVPAATPVAWALASAEYLGSIAIIAGLGARAGAVLLALAYGFVLFQMQAGGLDPRTGGGELLAILGMLSLTLILTGPGRLSVGGVVAGESARAGPARVKRRWA